MRAQAIQTSCRTPTPTKKCVRARYYYPSRSRLTIAQRIEHAGYHRSILQRNPPRFDQDGDIVEVDDEFDEDDDLEVVEENPYGNIQLESM
jgi:hypothetical protein